jgi:hypothetical protein
MPAPFEVFASGAFDVYLAVPLQADPPINAAPPGAWIKVGVAGAIDYAEDGIKVSKATENNVIYSLGQFGARKVFRTRETLTVELTLMDATMEAYRDAFNQSAVTTIVGPPAEKTIPLLEGSSTPTTRALLIRGANSPYMDGGVMQWWIPIVYQTGSPEAILRKNEPIGLALQFTAISDATNGFGKIHAQTS